LENNHPIALNEVKNPIIPHPKAPKRFEIRPKRLAVIRRRSTKTIFDRRLDTPQYVTVDMPEIIVNLRMIQDIEQLEGL